MKFRAPANAVPIANPCHTTLARGLHLLWLAIFIGGIARCFYIYSFYSKEICYDYGTRAERS